MTERSLWELPLPVRLQEKVDAAPKSLAELDQYVRETVAAEWKEPEIQDWALHAYFDDFRLTRNVRHVTREVLRDARFFGAALRLRREKLL